MRVSGIGTSQDGVTSVRPGVSGDGSPGRASRALIQQVEIFQPC